MRDQSAYIKPPEIAERLGVSIQTVYRHTRAGLLPHYRIGKAFRYPRPEVEAVIARMTTIIQGSK